MEIKVSKEDLNGALNTVLKAVPNKTTMPILECVLFDVTDRIKIVGNDMELGIETVVDGEIIEGGKVAIEAKLLSEIARKLPAGDISIKVDDVCKIKSGKSKFNVAVKDGEDYPTIASVARETAIKVSQNDLKTAIMQTIFAAAINDTNKVMTGELFQVEGNKLTLTALDGHRIAIRSLSLNENYKGQKVIIPAKTLLEISRILDNTGDLDIYITDQNILFEYGNTVVTSRLIEGEYFDVSKITNIEATTKISIDRQELVNALDRAVLFVNEGNKKPVVCNITDVLEMKINAPMGSLDESIDISKDGQDIEIGFDPKLLMDALRAIDEDTATLNLSNPKSPCVIKDEADTYCYVVLPVNFR